MQQSRTQRLAATQRVTVQQFESRMNQRRVAEAQQGELERFRSANTRLAANNQSDDRVDTLRRQRRQQAQNAELQRGYAIEQSIRENQQRELLRTQDQELAAAMAKMNATQRAKETNERRLCDDSEELKELKAQLKAAQMNKMRATQIAEKQLIHEQNVTREAMVDAVMEQERRAALEAEYEAELERIQANLARKAGLAEQMREQEKQREQAYQEFLKEKQQVDDIVRSVEEEDRAKAHAHAQKQAELQQSIRQYLADNQRYKDEERQRTEAENQKIAEYNALQEQRLKEAQAVKKAKDDAADAILAQITAEIERKRAEEEEYQRLLFELYQEEASAKRDADMEARREKERRMRAEMIKANEIQKQLKKQREAQLQEEEDEIRRTMIEKFHADEKLEQMNQQRRRREMQNYKAEVEAHIAKRRKMYEEQILAERREREQMDKAEALRQEIIEMERRRLLALHAKDLDGYLPKGVFRDENEYKQVLGRDAKPDDGPYPPRHAPPRSGLGATGNDY